MLRSKIYVSACPYLWFPNYKLICQSFLLLTFLLSVKCRIVILIILKLHVHAGERKDQKTLERLRAERQAKIDELKERTNYYTTQQLIQVTITSYLAQYFMCSIELSLDLFLFICVCVCASAIMCGEGEFSFYSLLLRH